MLFFDFRRFLFIGAELIFHGICQTENHGFVVVHDSCNLATHAGAQCAHVLHHLLHRLENVLVAAADRLLLLIARLGESIRLLAIAACGSNRKNLLSRVREKLNMLRLVQHTQNLLGYRHAGCVALDIRSEVGGGVDEFEVECRKINRHEFTSFQNLIDCLLRR